MNIPETIQSVLRTDTNWVSYGLGETEPNTIKLLTELPNFQFNIFELKHYRNIPAIIISQDFAYTERRSHTYDSEVSYSDIRVSSTSKSNAYSLMKGVRNILLKTRISSDFEFVWYEDVRNMCDNQKKNWLYFFKIYMQQPVERT